MALNEQSHLFRIDTGRDIYGESFERALSQHGGSLRNGYRVHIDDAVIAIIVVLQKRPVPDRSEIVSECEIAAGLYAREYCFSDLIMSICLSLSLYLLTGLMADRVPSNVPAPFFLSEEIVSSYLIFL